MGRQAGYLPPSGFPSAPPSDKESKRKPSKWTSPSSGVLAMALSQREAFDKLYKVRAKFSGDVGSIAVRFALTFPFVTTYFHFSGQLVTTKAAVAMAEANKRASASALVADVAELMMYVAGIQKGAVRRASNPNLHCIILCITTHTRHRTRLADARALWDVLSLLAHHSGWDSLAVSLRQKQAECEALLEDWGAYISTCLALLTAGRFRVSESAHQQREWLQDALLDSIARLTFQHTRAAQPLIHLLLPAPFNGARTLAANVSEDGTTVTVKVRIISRLPKPLRVDAIRVVLDRHDLGESAAHPRSAYACGPVTLAPDGVTTVELTYSVGA